MSTHFEEKSPARSSDHGEKTGLGGELIGHSKPRTVPEPRFNLDELPKPPIEPSDSRLD